MTDTTTGRDPDPETVEEAEFYVRNLGTRLACYGALMTVLSDEWANDLELKGLPRSGALVPSLAAEAIARPADETDTKPLSERISDWREEVLDPDGVTYVPIGTLHAADLLQDADRIIAALESGLREAIDHIDNIPDATTMIQPHTGRFKLLAKLRKLI